MRRFQNSGEAVEKQADHKREDAEERCGFALEGCTGVGTIRVETPRGDLIMAICKTCDATEKGSIY